jgi:hypothetical protein
MLCSSFGPTKNNIQSFKKTTIYRVLGDKGMIKYKKTFDSNNRDLVRSFFNDPLIIKLWPKVVHQIKEDQTINKTVLGK